MNASPPPAAVALTCSWRIGGQVKEKRILTSQKNKDWRGYRLNIQTTGYTIELAVGEQALFDSVDKGDVLDMSGDFEIKDGRTTFVLQTATAVDLAVYYAMMAAAHGAAVAPPATAAPAKSVTATDARVAASSNGAAVKA